MNELMPFRFEDHEVRVFIRDGNPWWVLNDVCAVLGIVSARKATARLSTEDVGQTPVLDARGIAQPTIIVNESGLYDLIFRSDKPQAKPFRRWVTSEVLPEIRRTGSYSLAPLPAVTTSEGLLLAVQRLVDIEREQKALAIEAEQQRQEIVEHATQLDDHEARLSGIEHRSGWYSALAFTKKHGLPANLDALKRLGRRAARLCYALGIVPGEVPDERFGKVKSYPEEILIKALAELSAEQ